MENLSRELEPIEIIQILEKDIVTEIKNVRKLQQQLGTIKPRISEKEGGSARNSQTEAQRI